jgi:hypothetical protein
VDYMESHDEERLMYKNVTYGNLQAAYSTKDTATALKRMEMAAAFFYLVPGPKMLWEFEELGYDYSINSNGGRLAPKPPRWDYMDQWRRKYLYNICSSLIDLKKNQEVFRTTDFTMNVAGAQKKMNLSSSSMDVTIVGNFDVYEGTIDPSFQKTGPWYDYFSGDTINVANTSDLLTLQPGEYHAYTSLKLQKPPFAGIGDQLQNGQDNKRFAEIFPNPSDEEITIRFSVSSRLNVEVVIYDLNNKIIKTFPTAYRGPGTHMIHWDLTGQNGIRVSPGIYFCRINYGNKSEMDKMIVQ